MNTQQLRNGAAVPVSKLPVKKRGKKLSDIPPYLRLMMFGKAGVGKTYLLGPLLEAGYKIIVLDSDVGGNGLNTVRSFLKERGKSNLLDNLILLPIESYEDAVAFVTNPEKTFNEWVDGTTWAEFDPDIICWEGFGNFQQVHVWKHVNPHQKPAEMIEAFDSFREWGEVLRATHFAIDDFAKLTGPNGKVLHKIWSTHLKDSDVDPTGKKVDPTDKAQKERLKQSYRPLISGSSAQMVTGAADYVIYAFTEAAYNPVSKEMKIAYCWDMTPSTIFKDGKVRGKMLTGGPIFKDVNPLEKWNEMLSNVSS